MFSKLENYKKKIKKIYPSDEFKANTMDTPIFDKCANTVVGLDRFVRENKAYYYVIHMTLR